MNKFLAVSAFVIAISSAVAAHPALAQDPTDPRPETKMEDKMGGKMDSKMAPKMDKMQKGKMDDKKKMSKEVYVCKECKTYYSAATAKKMMSKDPMGHMLKKMKSAPKGYMDGDKMKGKM